jgi:putative ABC transport system permease protein
LAAAPIAYFILNRWLEGFAYRVTLGPWVFVLAGLLALFVAFLTVSYQSIRAALSDPVNSLRYE